MEEKKSDGHFFLFVVGGEVKWTINNRRFALSLALGTAVSAAARDVRRSPRRLPGKRTSDRNMGKGFDSVTAGRPIRCRAAVCRGPEMPLVIEEVVVPVPLASQVRIKIICTSLCHTDLNLWKMKSFPAFFPSIFGHESVGVVESVGEGVTKMAVGDTVLPTFLGQCGACSDCRSDKSNICRTGFKFVPDEGRFTDAYGQKIYNFLSVSSFTEYTVVDAAQVVKIDPTIPPEKACLLSCGVATGIGAAIKVAKVEKGSTVAVFGLGTVGLAVVEGARLQGASKIIGVDLNPDKFEIGRKFGLTDFVNPRAIGDQAVSQVINQMTGGGADYCFECVGLSSVMTDALDSAREGWGKTIVLGVELNGAPLTVNGATILLGKSIVGSLFGGIKPQKDLPVLAKRYLDEEIHLDDFITHEVGFQEINKAFDLLIQGKSLRCIIWLDR